MAASANSLAQEDGSQSARRLLQQIHTSQIPMKQPLIIKTREETILDMCITMRHDYGLDRNPEALIGCGMTDQERALLHMQMSQIYDTYVAPLVEQVIKDLRD